MAGVKGKEIEIFAGKYIGYKAWINTSKKSTMKTCHIIYEDTDGSLKNTFIYKKSFKEKSNYSRTLVVNSFEQACLQQHPKVDFMIDRLCTEIAMFDISSESTAFFMKYFGGKLDQAIEKQHQLGTNALFRRVEYNWDNDNNNANVIEDGLMDATCG
jgi:hypothetical protein